MKINIDLYSVQVKSRIAVKFTFKICSTFSAIKEDFYSFFLKLNFMIALLFQLPVNCVKVISNEAFTVTYVNRCCILEPYVDSINIFTAEKCFRLCCVCVVKSEE